MASNNQKFEKLNLLDFDLLGMFRLYDAEGIESLCTPVGDGSWISRGKLYCKESTCEEASKFREELKEDLKKYPEGKKAFVIVDHMATMSGKVYYQAVDRAIKTGDTSGLAEAKQCLIDDVANVIELIEGRPATVKTSVLPKYPEKFANRVIECNNMALIYNYARNFDVPEGYKHLNTGLGGIFLGPFFKNMYGMDWTNLLWSKYINDTDGNQRTDLFSRLVDPSILDSKKILLLDDNIGTGNTIREIATRFGLQGCDIKIGAVQYNWINFYKVGIGEKTDITRFSPREIDYLNQNNYPGHKLLKHAYAILCGRRDLRGNEPSRSHSTPPGFAYLLYLRSKGYNKGFDPTEIANGPFYVGGEKLEIKEEPPISDILMCQLRGLSYMDKSGIDVFDDKGNFAPQQFFNKDSSKLMSALDDFNGTLLAQQEGIPLPPRKLKGQGQPGDN